MRPKLIIFDWDNTLIDAWGKLHAVMAATQEAMGLKPWTLEEAKQKMHKSSKDAFPKLFGDRWREAKDTFYSIYDDKSFMKTTPMIGAQKTLEYLMKNDIPAAIVSNKNGELLRKEVGELEWNRYFKSIVGSYDAKEDKPSAEPVLHTLRSLGMQEGPHNWFIGDTIVDMECAQRSGCTPVFFGLPENSAPHPKDLNIKHFHTKTHQDLQNLMDSFSATK